MRRPQAATKGGAADAAAGVQFWDISDGKHWSEQQRADSGAGLAAPCRNHRDPLRRTVDSVSRRAGAALEQLAFAIAGKRNDRAAAVERIDAVGVTLRHH